MDVFFKGYILIIHGDYKLKGYNNNNGFFVIIKNLFLNKSQCEFLLIYNLKKYKISF